ncbi:MAG TPA: MFS transporter [Candidatus Limnocylindrales bacterium]|nr:MFS transporter [Candidatus Limnocylindrales bacterium]
MWSNRLGLLTRPDFRRLWLAETISQFGTQVSLLAIPTVAILALQAPPFEVALLGTVEFLPFLLFALPAGVWVDRLRRRPILIAGDLGRAASLASIPIAYELGALSIWHLYVVGFVNGVLTVFFDVAYQSYLPSLVERDELVEGNSKLEVSRSAAQIVGPGVAGGLIGLVTAPLAIVADAVSYVGSAAFVTRIRRDEVLPERAPEGGRGPSMREEIGTGLRFVLGHPYLRMIAGATGSSNLFSNIQFSLLLYYMYTVLALTPEAVGLIFAIGSIGALVGAVTANRIAGIIGVGPAIVGSIALGFPAAILVPLAPVSAPHAFLIVSAALVSFSGLVYNINQVSFRQAITPERMQGRMNATMRFVVWGTIPVGQIVGGAIATAFGVTAAMWVGGIGAVVPPLFVLFSPVRRLRLMPRPTGDGLEIHEIEAATRRRRPGEVDPGVLAEALDEEPRPTSASAPLVRDDADR